MSTSSALRGAATTVFSRFFVTLPVPSPDADLSNQVFIVTGSNGGLGLEAVRHLSRLGAGRIIMAVRNEEKGREAKETILASTGRSISSIEVWLLDMASYDSIKEFAKQASALPRVDGILANAGIMTRNFELREGTEQTLTVNVIGTFLLYLLLAPKMRDSYRQTGNVCRYVIPNSALHFISPITDLKIRTEGLFGRLSDPKKADMAGRYSLSKLLVIYAVRELGKRAAEASNSRVTINTPNPSFCKSKLARESQGSSAFRLSEKIFARTTEEGSRTTVHGLFAGEESNGQYLTNCHVETLQETCRPSYEVTAKWGQETQKYFFSELLTKLEEIQPGISANM